MCVANFSLKNLKEFLRSFLLKNFEVTLGIAHRAIPKVKSFRKFSYLHKLTKFYFAQEDFSNATDGSSPLDTKT